MFPVRSVAWGLLRGLAPDRAWGEGQLGAVMGLSGVRLPAQPAHRGVAGATWPVAHWARLPPIRGFPVGVDPEGLQPVHPRPAAVLGDALGGPAFQDAAAARAVRAVRSRCPRATWRGWRCRRTWRSRVKAPGAGSHHKPSMWRRVSPSSDGRWLSWPKAV